MLASSKMDRDQRFTSDLTSLRSLLGPHLEALEAYLLEEAEQFEPEIQDLVRYCLGSGGKRIRASLVFLAGWQEAGEVREDLVRLAAVVELVHLATLVHDDILDSAATRHNRMTAARKYGPATAVLLGDAIFAQAVVLSTRFADRSVCRQVSTATRRVCVGEISQTLRRTNTGFGLREYFRVVDLKTAELFAVSCQLGARLGGYSDDFIAAVADFGRHLGVAYQIYDDLVDLFGEEGEAGKTLGTDVQSGKLTLPLIFLREKLDPQEWSLLLGDLAGGDPDVARRRIEEMVERGVYDEVVEAVVREASRAEEALHPFGALPPTAPLLQIHQRLRVQVAALRAD